MPVPELCPLPAKPVADHIKKASLAFVGWVLISFSPAAQAQTTAIEGTPPGYIETGFPPFVVLGPEALGLNAAPVDLQQMPDGRLLVFGRGELALGDGVRWEVFRQANDDPKVHTDNVAVDKNGSIYAGMAGGFGQIQFDQHGHWRYALVEKSPPELGAVRDAFTSVFSVGNEWFWSWGSGPIVQWQPDGAARQVGHVNALERVFAIGSTVHMSDQSNGALFRFEGGNFHQVDLLPDRYIAQTITCSAPLGDRITLLGTINLGLLKFDGKNFSFLSTEKLLSGSHRINDLCALGHGLVAVALDNVGVVFIDQNGRIVQSLDRSVDNRLSRVKRLQCAPGGAIWALLNEGIVRIAFPARVSSFESMVTTGLAFSQVFRHEGRLWLMSDGQAQRGVYNDDHRLIRFEVDTPSSNPYLTTMIDLDGAWVASTNQGLFRHEADGVWTKIAEGPKSAHIRPVPVSPHCWLYAAENESGWLRHVGNDFVFERFREPQVGHVYGAIADAKGVFWAELGTARVARIEATLPKPTVDIFGPAEGIPDGWAQLFTFEGEVRANVHDTILHYDANPPRFTVDEDLLRRLPALSGALGRPSPDSRGRMWITKAENLLVIDPRSAQQNQSTEIITEGLRPYYYTPQTDGVMWMNERMRLERFDPTLPEPDHASLQATITRVEFPATGSVLYPVDGKIPEVPSNDNTLLVHYLAPNQPFGHSVDFEVWLEGSGATWVSSGSNGSITFNHLDPGTYNLHVRTRVGAETSAEARLAFSVLAPWYQSRPAYLLLGATALVIVGLAVWLSTYIERREKTRLERLVAIRTRELHATNQELARQFQETTEKALALRASEERFRRLSENAPDIIFRIRVGPDACFDYVSPAVTVITGYLPEEFLADPTFPRKITQPSGAETIYDTALGGRVPEGVRDVRWKTRDGRVITLEERLAPVHDATGKLVAIEGISRDITQWVEQQEHRQLLESQLLQSQKLESVGTLAGGIAHDFNNILTGILGFCELAALSIAGNQEGLDCLREIRSAGLRAKDLVNQILTFSRRAESKLAAVDLALVVQEAMKLVRASTPTTIAIETDLVSGIVQADSTQIHQIIVNLCTNGVHAMQSSQGTLRISVRRIPPETELAREIPDFPAGPCVQLAVSDTGHGMDQATLARIFDPFFTTKKPGEGTGLGLSIVQGIVANHGAALRVLSQIDHGSAFEIYFPESTTPLRPSAPSFPPPPGFQRSILVVDDEPAVAAFVVAALKRYDYQVTAFSDPREAVAAFLASPSRFDAIVTDLTMPHLTGVELVRRVRASGGNVPVVLTSGFNKELTALPPEVAFRTFPISKPFDSVDLARILGYALQSARTPAQPR